MKVKKKRKENKRMDDKETKYRGKESNYREGIFQKSGEKRSAPEGTGLQEIVLTRNSIQSDRL